MLVLLVAGAKILAVKADTSIELAHLPFQHACLTWPACLVGLPALLARLPFRPTCLVCACY
jgi:hypothetical protein